MDDADKRRIGEQLEPGGRPKAPGRLELLQRFVNTHNHDFPEDWDRLGTAAKATAWLREKGLIAAGARVSAAEAARLRELREALRALIVAGHDGLLDPAAIATIAAASPSCVVLTPRPAARARPADAASMPTIHVASSAWLRRILKSRSVPMLPDPMMTEPIFMASPESHPTFADPFDR